MSTLRVALDAPPPWRAQAAAALGSGVQLVARDAEAELAGVLRPAAATPDGWQRALPPAEVVARALNPADTAALADARQFDTSYLWRRSLPPEALVRAARPHLPAHMGLRRLYDPALAIPHAGSPAVARVNGRLVALFVRAQALWRAESSDEGASWSAPAPLGIEAVDPALVAPEREGDPWRLLAVTFPRRDADPVGQDTQIRSWTSPDLLSFTPEPGLRLAGRGLLDPTLARVAGSWELWLTQAGRGLVRATSADGMSFTRAQTDALPGFTVPELSPDGATLLVQARVGDRTGVYAIPREDAMASPPLTSLWTHPARPLEGCGTGATFVRSAASPPGALPEVWVSDHAGACGPPYAWPERLKAR